MPYKMKCGDLNKYLIVMILVLIIAESNSYKWNPTKWIGDQEVNLGSSETNVKYESSKNRDEVKVLKQWIASIQSHVDTLLHVKDNWKICTQTVKEKDIEILRLSSHNIALYNDLMKEREATETLRSRMEKSEAQLKDAQSELKNLHKENQELLGKIKKQTEEIQSEDPFVIVDKFRKTYGLKIDEKNTMLHACTKNRSDVVEALLDMGVDIHIRMTESEWTCLHFVAQLSYIHLAKVLLKRGCNVDIRNIYLSTPLMEAAWHEKLEMAQLFIDHNADINARVTFDKKTAYSFVKIAGKMNGAEFLKSKGALESHDPSFTVRTFKNENNLINNTNDQTMFHACLKNRTDVVEALLDLGVDIHVRMGEHQWACLHFTASKNYIEMAKLLLKRGCNVDVRNSYLSTPLMEAAWHEKLEMAQLFIDHNADINARVTFDKKTAYSFVKIAGKMNGAEFLKSKGALESHDPSFTVRTFKNENNLIKNTNDQTMFHACLKNRTDVVEALLDLGVDIHVRMGEHQWACLHFTASKNYIEMAKLLLKRGCNVDVRNIYLSTPLLEAGWHENLEMAQLFIDHKADVNARVGYYANQTVYSFVKSGGKLKGAEFLKSKGGYEP